jgi:Dockerin type I domain
MTRHIKYRQLEVEKLADRLAFAAIDFLVLESSALPNNLAINPIVTQSKVPNFRQVSLIEDNQIRATGLHPQANLLITQSRALDLPVGAVDHVVERAIDEDSAFGFANFDDSRTEAILWMNPQRPVLLGDSIPLAAHKWPDNSVDIAISTGTNIRVIRFSSEGVLQGTHELDGTKYADAIASHGGIALLGTENDQPVAALIDRPFNLSEVALAMPPDSTFATVVGVSQVTATSTTVFIGSGIDSSGETRVLRWDQAGALIDQSSTVDIWALKSSGNAVLVDSQQTISLMVYDSAVASLLAIQVGVPANANQLKILEGRGFTSVAFTDVVERDGEIFIGIIATDASNREIQGIIVGTPNRFPSAWNNPAKAEDVTQDTLITPTDALLIINELNIQGGRILNSNDLALVFRVDVNADGILSPVDALRVINLLNSRGSSEGEGERSEFTNEEADSYFNSNLPLQPELIEDVRKRSRFWA